MRKTCLESQITLPTHMTNQGGMMKLRVQSALSKEGIRKSASQVDPLHQGQ